MSVYAKKGICVRLIYLLIAVAGYLVALARRFGDGYGLVLCYHGVLPKQKEQFKRQMTFLSRRRGRSPEIWMTFDDAFSNLLDNALPILEEFQIPAIVFAVPGNLGEKPRWAITADHPEAGEVTTTAEQLKALSKHPLICIGSHTQTHPDLSTLPPDKVQWELAESKQNLEHLLSLPVEDLALPHGAFNKQVLEIAAKVSYKRIYTLQPRRMPRDDMQKGVIGRFLMAPDVWPIEFWLTCEGAYAWLAPWRRIWVAIRKRVKNSR